jgi:hypothetical protein
MCGPDLQQDRGNNGRQWQGTVRGGRRTQMRQYPRSRGLDLKAASQQSPGRPALTPTDDRSTSGNGVGEPAGRYLGRQVEFDIRTSSKVLDEVIRPAVHKSVAGHDIDPEHDPAQSGRSARAVDTEGFLSSRPHCVRYPSTGQATQAEADRPLIRYAGGRIDCGRRRSSGTAP